MKIVFCCITLLMGNFLWQFFFEETANYMIALQKTYFQSVAILIYEYIFNRAYI